MKATLAPGLEHEFQYVVPENKTVPYLFPEAVELQIMPRVLATGFMVGLFEWTCIQAINPHIDWPREQTVGIDVQFSHLAATPPGMTVLVKAVLDKVEGRKLTFSITAYDDLDKISEGMHDRFVIDAETFNATILKKAQRTSIV